MVSEKSKFESKSKSKLIVTVAILTVFIALAAFASYSISASSASAFTINLPQTGQTTCYDASGSKIACAGTRQDGDIKAGVAWPNPRFTDNGDQTMTDKLTGLAWAKDAGTPTKGSCTGGAMAWTNALDYVACLNTANYLGHNDWRLPNINELESLVNAEQSYPNQWLGTQGYANVQSNWYWSSTTFAYWNDYAWIVYMGNGYVDGIVKSNNSYVWPVRAGQSGSFGNSAIWATGQTQSYHSGDDGAIKTGAVWPSPRFIDNGDGTVMDNLTGLTWTKNANLAGTYKTWQQALDYVASMNTGAGTYGHTDWRMPNRKELRGLADYSKYSASLLAGNPFTNVQASYYWSSTSNANNTGYAWIVYMSHGHVYGLVKSNNYCVWPVRMGQIGNLANLVISRTGTGIGTVTSADGKINCGSACSGTYSPGTGVTLTAAASSGSTFAGWSGGGCSGTSFCTVTINSDTTITATFNSNATPTPTPTPTPTLTPTPTPITHVDKAIIVAGGGPFNGNVLWDSTKTTADNAYNTLIAQGFTKDTIKYLSAEKGSNPYVNDTATSDNLKNAINNWASDAKDIVIYFTDHGGYGTFTMGETDILQAATFKNSLDVLQTQISGMIVFIYDACESGSFIAYLTPPAGKLRILISSAKSDQQAYFVTKGLISFSNYFWNKILNGANIDDAFVDAKNATSVLSTNQIAQIDDNGNGIPNEKDDGELAATKHIGKGIAAAAGGLRVMAVSTDTPTLSGSSSAKIIINDADISHTETVQKVWAIIIPPGYSTGSSAIPVTDLPTVELNYAGASKRYEGTYTQFSASGKYTVSAYAMDDKGNLSMPVSTTVTQTASSASNPKPVVTVNGSNAYSVDLTTFDRLTLAVSLDPGIGAGKKADWWLYTYTPYGTFYFDLSTNWTFGYKVTYTGELFDLPSTPVLTLPLKGLQPGNYMFIFEVDTNPDSIRNGDIYTSSVGVNVK
ncbi:MAG: DUF1566 domain-containing protein [Nitrospirae bacterium]|nr:DUF1566 domain-containing protein [Nitrospirota bacterium]